MCGTSGACNDQFQTALASGAYIFSRAVRRPVRTVDSDLVRNFKLLQDFYRLLHDWKIGIAAHNNADQRLHIISQDLSFQYPADSLYLQILSSRQPSTPDPE